MNLELGISLGRQNRAKKKYAAVFELGDNETGRSAKGKYMKKAERHKKLLKCWSFH